MSKQVEEQTVTGITLAKDALKWLSSWKIEACNGSYIETHIEYDHLKEDAKTLIEKYERPCRVCQMGALAIAYILREDKVTIGEYVYLGQQEIHELLAGYIPPRTLALMETAFERAESFYTRVIADELSAQRDLDEDEITRQIEEIHLPLATKACNFGSRYKLPRNRMRAVFQNFIDNKGEFKP